MFTFVRHPCSVRRPFYVRIRAADEPQEKPSLDVPDCPQQACESGLKRLECNGILFE